MLLSQILRAGNRRGGGPNYVYNLPLTPRRNICRLLNEINKWEELAVLMKYDVQEIERIKKIKDPTDGLLENWSHSNTTIEALFAPLSKIRSYEVMSVFQLNVEKKIHRLIDEGERDLSRLYHLTIRNSDSEEVIRPLSPMTENFNKVQLAKRSDQKVAVTNRLNKDLGGIKILNCLPQLTTDLIPNESDNMLASPTTFKLQSEYCLNLSRSRVFSRYQIHSNLVWDVDAFQ